MTQAKDLSQSLRIGCAGWTVAKEHSHLFPTVGSHLERYATLFDTVEINMTFYRLPREATVTSWKEQVPSNFRFAVKLSKEITHTGRLRNLGNMPLFIERMRHLEEKLGPILVQLPPSLAFDANVASLFFQACVAMHDGPWVLEPRHLTWFGQEASDLLQRFCIALVAADPAISPQGTVPAGWQGLHYYRLHGSPKMYFSSYSEDYLRDFSAKITKDSISKPVWAIFDNTASGAAVENGIFLKSLLA